jgi:hypothetical protein
MTEDQKHRNNFLVVLQRNRTGRTGTKTMPHRKERSNLDEAIYKSYVQAQARPCSPEAPTLVQIYEQVGWNHIGSIHGIGASRRQYL